VKFGLEAFPPFWSGFLRFALGSLCVIAWARMARIPLKPARDEWPLHLALGLLFTVQIVVMNTGFGATTAANGAVLNATNPLFGMLFAHFLVPGDRLTSARVLGAVVAFAGTALVLGRGAVAAGGDASSYGDWLVLGAACLLGLRLALSGRLLRRVNEVRVVAWQMFLSLPLFAAGGLAFETVRFEHIGVAPVAGILYQGVVIAGLGFTINFYLIRRYQPSVMISFNFVAPLAGVLLGAWLLDERIGAGLLGGMALVAAGLVLIARK